MVEHIKKRINELVEELNRNINQLYDAAIHDAKTNLYNSKFFDTMLDFEMAHAKRGEELCLFIIDLDYFKKINDKYGHMIGDKVLVHFAKFLTNHVRKSDIVSRFGGEEFLILFPSTNLRNAEKFVKRLKNKLESEKLLKKYNITFSGSLTQYKKSDTKTSLKKRADKALYQAKKQRNKLVVLK